MDGEGLSGVFHAARYGHLDSLTAILKAGSDANKGRDDGACPIWIAAENGQAPCMQQLGAFASLCSGRACRTRVDS